MCGAPGRVRHTLSSLERYAYRRVTKQIKAYPAVFNVAKRLALNLSFDMTYDNWRQVVALATLKDHWSEFKLEHKTFALTGNGDGFLGALIRHVLPDSLIYHIDLPKVLVFQAQTHTIASPHSTMSVMPSEQGQTETTFVQPKDIDLISDQIDCAINIASMQEMPDTSIASYFKFLRLRNRPSSRFYCVNREHKELPGGEITTFESYPWSQNDEKYVDGLCPYYTFFLGRGQLKGPKVFGRKVPLFSYFDGPIMHRLCHLEPSS